MTDEELEAGRELDELIAVRVMGWMMFPYQMSPVTGNRFDYCPPGEVHVSTIQRVPDYSTDIAAAWEVVEAFERGRVVGDKPGWPDSHGWFVAFYRCPVGWEIQIGADAIAQAQTAPLAICRAALKATETKG